MKECLTECESFWSLRNLSGSIDFCGDQKYGMLGWKAGDFSASMHARDGASLILIPLPFRRGTRAIISQGRITSHPPGVSQSPSRRPAPNGPSSTPPTPPLTHHRRSVHPCFSSTPPTPPLTHHCGSVHLASRQQRMCRAARDAIEVPGHQHRDVSTEVWGVKCGRVRSPAASIRMPILHGVESGVWGGKCEAASGCWH